MALGVKASVTFKEKRGKPIDEREMSGKRIACSVGLILIT